MANQQKRIKALIDKNIRDILQFELKNEVGFLTFTNTSNNISLGARNNGNILIYSRGTGYI